MPVNVIKKPEWGLLYYLFQGYCTSAEVVHATQQATQHFPPGELRTVFDLLEGELDIEQVDVKQVLSENKLLFDNGIITTHAAVLTYNQSLKLFLTAFELIMVGVPTKIATFSSISEGLSWIGLTRHEVELNSMLSNMRHVP